MLRHDDHVAVRFGVLVPARPGLEVGRRLEAAVQRQDHRVGRRAGATARSTGTRTNLARRCRSRCRWARAPGRCSARLGRPPAERPRPCRAPPSCRRVRPSTRPGLRRRPARRGGPGRGSCSQRIGRGRRTGYRKLGSPAARAASSDCKKQPPRFSGPVRPADIEEVTGRVDAAYQRWLQENAIASLWIYSGLIAVLVPAFHYVLASLPGVPPGSDSMPLRCAAAGWSSSSSWRSGGFRRCAGTPRRSSSRT